MWHKSGESMEDGGIREEVKIWLSHLTDSLFISKLMQDKLPSTELYTVLKKMRRVGKLNGRNVLAGSTLIARQTHITEDVGT